MPFTTRTEKMEPGITVVVLTGRMHLGNQLRELEDAIRKMISDGSRKMILDLSGIEMLDSAALGMLLMTTGTMADEGGTALIAGTTARVNEVLRVAQAHRVLSLHADVASAVRSF